MNLSADDLFEINQALHDGWHDADWHGLTAAERATNLALSRAHAERRLADPDRSEVVRRSLVDFAMTDAGRDECQRMAIAYERGGAPR